MKGEWKFIGFDLGAESGRCIVAALKDQKIKLNQVHRFATHTVKLANELHWDVLAIFDEIIKGLSKAKDEFGADFDGIGIDTWGVDYVLIDSNGRPLSYPYHYRDNRTDGIMEEAFKILSKESIYAKAGNQAAQYNTLFQLLAEKKKKTNLLNISDKFMLMPDYFNFLLSGKKRAEFTIASTTNLTNPITRDWLWELIDTFGMPKTIFPEIVEPGTKLGTLLPWLAKETGLNTNIPIIAVAGHDTASAVASIPAMESRRAFLSSGTWSLMGVELDKPILNKIALNYGFTNEGGFNKTNQLLKNIIGLWPIQECRKSWIAEGNEYSYAQLADMSKTAGFVNAWVDLSDSRFLKPGNMPEKICDYLFETNQILKKEIGFIVAVILESLAFTYRKTLKEIEELTGEKIERLHIVGGGIQNEALTQYTADAIGRIVNAGPIEGAVAGNIGAQAISIGAVPDIKCWRNIVAGSFAIKEYSPINTKYYVDNEDNYEKILKINMEKKK
jgi:rhamnulokinase